MRIQTTSGIDFILPKDFKAKQTIYNVLLSERGEQTDPITLPGVPHNLELIGWSNRVDATYKPLTDLQVLITDGIISRWCNMGIHSADDVDGISCTLYFATGDFYSRIDGKKLAGLPFPTFYHSNYNLPLADRVQYLINILRTEALNPTDTSIFGIVPVATTQEYTWNTGTKAAPVKVTGLFVLNAYEKRKFALDNTNTQNLTLTKFEGEYTQMVMDGDSSIDLSLGYGMTPFLKVRYVLNLIFSTYGYTINMSRATDLAQPYPNRMLLVNNVADAIYSGILKFSQLVPDVTISEFIAEIERLFAGKFVIDEVSKVATFCPYTTQLQAQVDLDLSPYLCSRPKMGSVEFSSIQIVNANAASSNSPSTVENTTTLSFNLGKSVVIRDDYKIAHTYLDDLGFPISKGYIDLNMVQIDGITHLNTDIVIDGKTEKSEKSVSNSIQLITRAWTNSYGQLTVRVNNSQIITVGVDYKASCSLFSETSGAVGAKNAFSYLVGTYSFWKVFKQSSNIPIYAKMNIPLHILEKMKLEYPKLLAGQRVMIEKIEFIRGDSAEQTVNCRTMRSYFDR